METTPGTHKENKEKDKPRAKPDAPSSSQRTAASDAKASLTETADQALQSVGQLYNAVDGALTQQMRDNTYVTLGAAAGVGFLIGGGLASPMGQMLVRVSMRAFGPPLVNALIQNALERANITLPGGGSR
jgi:hypothetical protein